MQLIKGAEQYMEAMAANPGNTADAIRAVVEDVILVGRPDAVDDEVYLRLATGAMFGHAVAKCEESWGLARPARPIQRHTAL